MSDNQSRLAAQVEWNLWAARAPDLDLPPPAIRVVLEGRAEPAGHRENCLEFLRAGIAQRLGKERFEREHDEVRQALVERLRGHLVNATHGTRLPAPPPEGNPLVDVVQPCVPFTVTLDFGDGTVVEHRSMAPHWLRALALAAHVLTREGRVNPQCIPEIKILQK